MRIVRPQQTTTCFLACYGGKGFACVLRLAQPVDQPDQLRLLWDRVANHLADNWNLACLSREAGCSHERLRRMCQSQLG